METKTKRQRREAKENRENQGKSIQDKLLQTDKTKKEKPEVIFQAKM